MEFEIHVVPTAELDTSRMSSLCRPHSRHPMISWAGVFGSVGRDKQQPDSDIGYSKDADFWRDVCGSIDNLFQVPGRKADVVPHMQNHETAYDMR